MKKIMMGTFIRNTVVYINYAEKFFLKRKIQYHRFEGRKWVGCKVINGEGVCKIKPDIGSNAYSCRVSKGG